MKSIAVQARQKMNKTGQTLNIVNGTVVGFMVLVFLLFAILFGVSSLNPSSFFTSGSAEANATSRLQANLTEGADTFGGYIPTIMKVLAVVLVMAAIVLLIIYIQRTRQASGGGQGGL